MELDRRRNKQSVNRGACNGICSFLPGDGERGQSTVEYAVIMAAFAVVLAGLAAFLHAFQGGMFVDHALSVASHHVTGAVPATIADIFLY